jgi:cyclopropane-fatty-acyl-phospholipid synthase
MSQPLTRTASASSLTTATAATKKSFWETALLSAFADMTRGHLHVELPDGSTRDFGDAQSARLAALPLQISASATLRIRRPAFFKKCALAGDIGFAESFIDGDWETPNLTALVAWFLQNLENAPTLSGSRRRSPLALNALRLVNRLGHLLRANTRANSARNIREHYDLSNDFFALFLDPSMMYSSALWTDPDASLADAQHEKNAALCRSLRLQPTDRVLEIGTGWGGWAVHAARHYGCHVTTATISQQQYDFARRRVIDAGLGDRIDVRLQDYRDISGSFDKIVSIEMLEAVGHAYQPKYFEVVSRLLKRNGLLALQYISCPDDRYDELRRGVDFIQKHIFPGSLLLSPNRVNDLLARAGGFTLHSFRDFGQDYARTLKLWRDAFLQKLPQVRALGFDDRFIRKWDYYLCYCEAAFAMRNISVVHTLHTRANNLAL